MKWKKQLNKSRKKIQDKKQEKNKREKKERQEKEIKRRMNNNANSDNRFRGVCFYLQNAEY